MGVIIDLYCFLLNFDVFFCIHYCFCVCFIFNKVGFMWFLIFCCIGFQEAL